MLGLVSVNSIWCDAVGMVLKLNCFHCTFTLDEIFFQVEEL